MDMSVSRAPGVSIAMPSNLDVVAMPAVWKAAVEIAHELPEVLSVDAVERLRQAILAGIGDEVTVAVVGQFNAGKSTLLNRLIGRSLLPTHDLTETGAVVCVRAGESLQASATGAEGEVRKIDATPDGLRAATSILDAEGVRRPSSAMARQVDIRVPGASLPRRLVLMDMPGFGDHAEVDEQVLGNAARADHVIFLLRSDVFLSESEVGMLARLLEGRSPASVHLVVNCIMQDPSEQNWQRFLREVLPIHRQRLAAHGAALGLPAGRPAHLVMVRASEVAGGPDHGFSELRELLQAMVDDAAPNWPVQRLMRLTGVLKDLSSMLGSRVMALTHEIESGEAKLARQAALVAAQVDCATQIGLRIATALERFEKEINQYVEHAAAGIGQGAIARDSSHRDKLQTAVTMAGDAQAIQLMDEVAVVARKLLRLSIESPKSGHPPLVKVFKVKVGPVEVPDTPVEGGVDVKKGMVAGAAIGTAIPIIGTLFGAIIGGVAASMDSSRRGQQAIDSDIRGLKNNIALAGGKAIRTLKSRRAEIEKVIAQMPEFAFAETNPEVAAGSQELQVLDGRRASLTFLQSLCRRALQQLQLERDHCTTMRHLMEQLAGKAQDALQSRAVSP